MSIKHVKGDILTTPTRNEDTVICHQVNCCGVMGAGLAKQIRDKWPVVFDEYKKICGTDRLGDSQTVQVAPQLYVANLFGQLNYGRDKRQTNYAALAAAIFGEMKVHPNASERGYSFIPVANDDLSTYLAKQQQKGCVMFDGAENEREIENTCRELRIPLRRCKLEGA